jgi:AraC family transcriptional regulator
MAGSPATAFRVEETHGILWRPENQIHTRSDELGWTSMYASVQREAPYEDHYDAVRDHLIVLHLDGPVAVARRLGRAESRRVIAPGGLFMLPGGMDSGCGWRASSTAFTSTFANMWWRRWPPTSVSILTPARS